MLVIHDQEVREVRRIQVDLKHLQSRHEVSWHDSYDDFVEIINSAKLECGVEVGVAFGGHCEAILRRSSVKQLFGVDSYQHRANYADPMNLPQPEFDKLCQLTSDRLQGFGSRFRLIRRDSEIASSEFAPKSIDFVYLDAEHSAEGVWRDIASWFFAVRDGGIIAGHDYGHESFPGVKTSVDRFFERFGWEVNHKPSGVWWVEKQALPISFFIPAFNCEDWIAESIRSILESNFRPQEGDELIIVDDGSSDGTWQRIASFSSQHDRIQVIQHETNLGGGVARNTAIENTLNPLCFCLDSDNVLAKESVHALRDHLIVNDVDTVAFQEMRYFTSELGLENPTHTWSFDDAIMDFAAFLQTNRAPSSSGNYLFTKNSWNKAGGYPEAGALDTWGFLLRKLAAGSKIKVLPQSYYFHRYSHDSYWVRHAQRGNLDEVAADLMEPYLERLVSADARYLKSAKGRRTWFSRLDRRPLRLRDEKLQPLSLLPLMTSRRSRLRCVESRHDAQLAQSANRRVA